MQPSEPRLSRAGEASSDGIWLQRHLGPVLEEYMNRHALALSDWRGQPLADDEVAGFRQAIEQELVFVDKSDGCLVLTEFRSTKRYRLFQNYARGAASPGRAWSWSWRECFTQIAFACELANEHGWPTGQIAFEVGAFDLAVGDGPARRPVILAEAKVHDRGQAGLEGMLAVFNELGGAAPAAVGEQVRVNASRKYADVLMKRPSVFAAVAPGVRRFFDVTITNECVSFSERRRGIRPADLTWQGRFD